MPIKPLTHAQRQGRAQKAKQDYDRHRRRRAPLLSSARWQRLRKMFLAKNPLCAICNRAATDVHHIEERTGRPDLAMSESNLQALCHECHSAITAKAHLARKTWL